MKLISLTFDDGPNTVTTPQVLDLLEEHGIAASFFLIANRINQDSAAVVRRALRLGCEIENHSTTHSMMAGMSPDQIRREVDHCTRMITENTTLFTINCSNGFIKVHKKPSTDPLYLVRRSFRTRLKIISR